METLDLDDYDLPIDNEPFSEERPPEAQDAQPQTQLDPNLGVEDLGVDEVIRTRTRAPQAKMDAGRALDAKRGLPVLRKAVSRVNFKGKNNERRDLIKLLGTYQIWAHYLFPKANFDDVLALCRRTGHDSQVRAWRRAQIDDEKYGLSAADSKARVEESDGRERTLEDNSFGVESCVSGSKSAERHNGEHNGNVHQRNASDEWLSDRERADREDEIRVLEARTIPSPSEPNMGSTDNSNVPESWRIDPEEERAAMSVLEDLGF